MRSARTNVPSRKPAVPTLRGLKRTADGNPKPSQPTTGFTATPLQSTPPSTLPAAAAPPAATAPPAADPQAEARDKYFRMPRVKLPIVMQKKQDLVQERRRAEMDLQKDMVQMEFQHAEVMKPELEQRDAKRRREAAAVDDAKEQMRSEWVATAGGLLGQQESETRAFVSRAENRVFTLLTGEMTVAQLDQNTRESHERSRKEAACRAATLESIKEHKVMEQHARQKTAEAQARNRATLSETDVICAERREVETDAEAWQARQRGAEAKMAEHRMALIHHEDERRRLHNKLEELKGNIRVFCRIRAPLNTERELAEFDIDESGRCLRLRGKERAALAGPTSKAEDYTFRYDSVFGPASTQEEVFKEIGPLVQSCLDGFKVCIFAYGQTGSGKTYTMEGPPTNKGVIPRAVNMIFHKVTTLTRERGFTCKLSCSFLEIYNDQIRDLLQKKGTAGMSLKLGGTETEAVVEGLSDHPVSNEETVVELLSTAQSNRACAATKMNDQSSRSHSVFMLRINVYDPVAKVTLSGLLNLIDLAGSEKVSASEVKGDRFKEAIAINSSLSHLGDVIHYLGQGGHVPFRNSTLTRLLRPSLGGSSKCLMLVNKLPRFFGPPSFAPCRRKSQ
eukprot:TRINITY_DN3312_c0_g2_i3.p1 TRINITY_DN3312_c0_g2~~TRINITY_DN3312_c0_g2_i3.p1  ORF type:complete len:621 (+),score=249.24 TRINITY_DN3312_c0_g2_i3:56-1918(+)